jgi:hypothetical protein
MKKSRGQKSCATVPLNYFGGLSGAQMGDFGKFVKKRQKITFKSLHFQNQRDNMDFL